MAEHVFSMRLNCGYKGDKNSITDLEVTHRISDRWRTLHLGVNSPGFDIFIYSVLACQHTYFRLNCAERGILLKEGEGRIDIHAGENWRITELKVHFSASPESGSATDDDIDYIISRMKLCPVSLNLGEIPSVMTSIDLK